MARLLGRSDPQSHDTRSAPPRHTKSEIPKATEFPPGMDEAALSQVFGGAKRGRYGKASCNDADDEAVGGEEGGEEGEEEDREEGGAGRRYRGGEGGDRQGNRQGDEFLEGYGDEEAGRAEGDEWEEGEEGEEGEYWEEGGPGKWGKEDDEEEAKVFGQAEYYPPIVTAELHAAIGDDKSTVRGLTF